jgi:hypothetical protein
LLLGKPRLVLLKLLGGEKHLYLLTIRRGLHPVGLTLRREIDRSSPATPSAPPAPSPRAAELDASLADRRAGRSGRRPISEIHFGCFIVRAIVAIIRVVGVSRCNGS